MNTLRRPSRRAAARGSIEFRSSLFNQARAYTPRLCSLCLLALFAFPACQEELPTPVDRLDATTPPPPPAPPRPEVPMTAPEIFERLPAPPPEFIPYVPGREALGLRSRRPGLRPVSDAPNVLAEHPKDGPFRSIAYYLDPSLRMIEGVVATFRGNNLDLGYRHPEHQGRLEEYMRARLGEGDAFDETHYLGRRWKNLDYRIELRSDKYTQDLELFFHIRGAETLERTQVNRARTPR
ncbi:MAG: hypothetical protein VYD19_08465 [Myxococcota bacterium]|nr:hypothetical protein [Myxococcota bacterium]